jgi:formamidopyrimidine-DNA glycosylase
MIGFLTLTTSPATFIGQKKIGPRFVSGEGNFFEDSFRKARRDKAILMDQNLVSGMGNVYSDENFVSGTDSSEAED